MKNEINILDQVVDMAIAKGVFTEKNSAGAAINAMGVVKTQVPKLIQELEDTRKKAEELQLQNEKVRKELDEYKQSPGKPKKVLTK